MTTICMLYHLAHADFLERVRRYDFLVMLTAVAFLGYLFVPPIDARYQTVTLGNARGIYSSSWVGAMFGLMLSTIASLLTFYLINNAVGRDRQTRVGEIIASTPASKMLYTMGKWLSNLAVLALIMVVLTIAALGMQLFRAEDVHLDIWALVAPIWLIGFPVMAVTAAVAVLFESISFLSAGFGGVVYFFAWLSVFAAVIAPMEDTTDGLMGSHNDFYGISRTIADMQQTILRYYPDYSGDFSIGSTRLSEDALIFHWKGLLWTPTMVCERLGWLFVGPVIIVLAALTFDRFDPARRRESPSRKPRPKEGMENCLGLKALDTVETVIPRISLSPLPNRRVYRRILAVVQAELRLMLRAQPRWWLLVAVGLVIASAVTPPDVTSILQAFVWLLPIFMWSSMGARERRHSTHELVFSVARPLRKQLAASWLAGVLIALSMTSGGLVRAISAGETSRAVMMGIGVIFVPSLALVCGVSSRTSRLFETLYLILWYIAFNGIPAFDFMGLGNADIQQRVWLIYLVLALLSLVMSFTIRRGQLQR